MSVDSNDFRRRKPYFNQYTSDFVPAPFEQFRDLADEVIPLTHELAVTPYCDISDDEIEERLYLMTDQEGHGHEPYLHLYGLEKALFGTEQIESAPRLTIPPPRRALPRNMAELNEQTAADRRRAANPFSGPIPDLGSCSMESDKSQVPAANLQPFLVSAALASSNFHLLIPGNNNLTSSSPVGAFPYIRHDRLVGPLAKMYESDEPLGSNALAFPFSLHNLTDAFPAATPGPESYGSLLLQCATADVAETKRDAFLDYALQGPIRAASAEYGSLLLKAAENVGHPTLDVGIQNYNSQLNLDDNN